MKEIIIKLLRGGSREHTKQLILICYPIVYTCLNYRSREIRYLQERSGLSQNDIAWDIMADLFKPGRKGIPDHFQAIFKHKELQNLPDEEVKILVRKSIFTKVNDGIFRLYDEYDHSLAKIIRNLKQALPKQGLELDKRCGSVIVFDEKNRACDQPFVPQPLLEARLIAAADSRMPIPEILSVTADQFLLLSDYRKEYPLSGLAIVIRNIFVKRMQPGQNGVQPFRDREFFDGEIEPLLRQSLEQIKEIHRPKYVETGKINRTDFELYFTVIEKYLSENYTGSFVNGYSQFEILNHHNPAIDYEQYRNNHRKYLEYLTKCVRDYFIQNCRSKLVI